MQQNMPTNLNPAPVPAAPAPNPAVEADQVSKAEVKPAGSKRSYKKLITLVLIFSTFLLTPIVGFLGILLMFRQGFGKIAKSILVVLFIVLTFLNIGIFVNYYDYDPATRSKSRIIAIKGDSMSPTFKKGSKLLTSEYKQGSSLKRDDIVAYSIGGYQLTEGALTFYRKNKCSSRR